MSEAVWIREQEVVDALDLGETIDVLERALLEEHAGRARTMVKTHVAWGDGHTLHAIGATYEAAGVVGTKTWAHTAGGATPLVVLWDADSGALRAVVEAFALGQLRTAGMTGVATRLLAPNDARRAAVLGTGKQALPQAAALAAVLPLETLRVHGRDRDRREAFARRVEEALGVPAVPATSPAEAVDGAHVVTTVTRATTAFLTGTMLDERVHVNAVGAITPERSEVDSSVLDRCDIIVTDSVDQARELATELAAHMDQVRPLSAAVADSVGRPPSADVTLFKSLGIGLADVAVAAAVLERAGGRPVPATSRAQPRLRRQEVGS